MVLNRKMNVLYRDSFVLPALLIVAMAGCGIRPISIPKTTPVKGSVTLKGKPASGVLVQFHPKFSTGKLKFIPSGETDATGKYVLSTGKPGDGAPVGDYVVTLRRNRIESDKQNSGIELEVDEFKGKYSNPDQSQFKVTVKAGENEIEAFQLD